MYFKFVVSAWVPHKDHAGCGSYKRETYSCASVVVAKLLFMRDHPTVNANNIEVNQL